MFNVQLDENNFFTGSYATIGVVPNGVNVETLPPTENQLCYKLVDSEVIKEIQQPVKIYYQTILSETEFDIYYVLQGVDEDGNQTQIHLTEDEYNLLSDEEKANTVMNQFPKIQTVELSEDEYNSLSDEEKMNVVAEYKQDELGNLVYEIVKVPEIVKDWEYSQEKYDELESKRLANEKQQQLDKEYRESISNETLKAENTMLAEQISMFTECLLEMSEIVYA